MKSKNIARYIFSLIVALGFMFSFLGIAWAAPELQNLDIGDVVPGEEVTVTFEGKIETWASFEFGIAFSTDSSIENTDDWVVTDAGNYDDVPMENSDATGKVGFVEDGTSEWHEISETVMVPEDYDGDYYVIVAASRDYMRCASWSCGPDIDVSATKAFSTGGGAGAPVSASVTTPSDTNYYNASSIPTTFSGSAADNADGSGLNANSTTFYIQRGSDSNYWDGSSGWGGTVDWLATTHSETTDGSTVTWSDNVTLPSWSEGTYYAGAKATNKDALSLEGSEITFYYDTTAPTVEGVIVQSTDTNVDVEFNENLDETTAETTSNYALNSTTNPTSATLQGDNVTVRLVFSSSVTERSDTLDISGVQDLAGNTMAAVDDHGIDPIGALFRSLTVSPNPIAAGQDLTVEFQGHGQEYDSLYYAIAFSTDTSIESSDDWVVSEDTGISHSVNPGVQGSSGTDWTDYSETITVPADYEDGTYYVVLIAKINGVQCDQGGNVFDDSGTAPFTVGISKGQVINIMMLN